MRRQGSFSPISMRRVRPRAFIWCLTAQDLTHLGPVVCQTPLKQPDGTRHVLKHVPLFCDGEVRYVGDAVAFIVAETLPQAQDAAELIDIDWEIDEAHVDLATALDPESPLVWPDLGTNQAFLYRRGDAGSDRSGFRPCRSSDDHRSSSTTG
jgi:carbon-monoxide dehydrogenase large subunit